MQLLDSVVNGKMLLYAAITNIATAYIHMRRIACDALVRGVRVLCTV